MKLPTTVPEMSSEPPSFEKTPGGADMAGELFEIKMLALIFLRCIASGDEFFLTSNMKDAGKFDDIILRRKIDHVWKTTFMQLKHKKTSSVCYGDLVSMSKDNKKNTFSLVKYGSAIQTLNQKHDVSNVLKWCGETDSFNFILYTNANADVNLVPGSITIVEPDLLFNSHSQGQAFLIENNSKCVNCIQEIQRFKDSIMKLNDIISELTEEEVKTKIESICLASGENLELNTKVGMLRNNPRKSTVDQLIKDMKFVLNSGTCYSHLLNKFHLFTSQSNEENLDRVIKQVIKECLSVEDEREKDEISKELCDLIQKWWKGNPTGSWLTRDSSIWSSILSLRIKQISMAKTYLLEKGDIKFDSKQAVEDTYNEIGNQMSYQSNCRERVNAYNVVVEVGTRTMVASKMNEAFLYTEDKEEKTHRSYVFIGLTNLVKRKDEILALLKYDTCEGIIIECEDDLIDDEVETTTELLLKQFVEKNLNFIVVCDKNSSVPNIMGGICINQISRIKFEWLDLHEESQRALMSKQVTFQGKQMTLCELVGELSENTDSFRNILPHMNTVTGETLVFLSKGQLKVGKSLEGPNEYFVERQITATINGLLQQNGRPSDDSNTNQVILLIAGPGMGKSTLINHEAHACKRSETENWVVKVNLIDCISFLSDPIQNNENAVTNFLAEFAFQKSDSKFEKSLIYYCLTHSGKLSVFLDGVDELCPQYEVEFCSLLDEFTKMKELKLWVSSRTCAQEKLEKIMDGTPTLYLKHFSRDDEDKFLEKMLEGNISSEYLPSVQEIIENSRELKADSVNLTAIPQQTKMLADFILSEININDQQCNCLNYLIVKRFVDEKFELYTKEKKQYNLKNPAVLSDHEYLRQLFMDIHMTAALIQLLPSNLRDSLSESPEVFMSKNKNILEKSGLVYKIDDENVPHFVHKVFAWYFAALWIFTYDSNLITRQSMSLITIPLISNFLESLTS